MGPKVGFWEFSWVLSMYHIGMNPFKLGLKACWEVLGVKGLGLRAVGVQGLGPFEFRAQGV